MCPVCVSLDEPKPMSATILHRSNPERRVPLDDVHLLRSKTKSLPSHSLSPTSPPTTPKLPSPSTLPRLTPIRPPPLHSTGLHTRTQINIHPRRDRKAKTLRHFLQIQLVDIEHRPQRVRGVGLQIGAVAVFGGLWSTCLLASAVIMGKEGQLTLLR